MVASVFLLNYTVLLLAASGIIAGVSFSAFMLSRNQAYFWFGLAYTFYCLDISLMLRPGFELATGSVYAPGHITSPLESVFYGSGVLFCFTTVMLNYAGLKSYWRVLAVLSFSLLSGLDYFLVEDPIWRQFGFFAVRNLFSLALLIAMTFVYLRTSDQFERSRFGRFRIPGLFITLGIFGIIGENVFFQLIVPLIKPSFESSPFMSERNFAENFVMMGLGVFILVRCRGIFLLHREDPKASYEDRSKRFVDRMLDDYYVKFKLSHREQDVLRALIRGKTNREIADELNIAIGTVKVHLHNISKKTGAKGRDGIIKSFFAEL